MDSLKNIIVKMLRFLALAFSENGSPSSKRIIGGIIMIVVMFCTTYSCVKAGMTENNKSIIEFEIITAGTLLGLSNVTDIWKNNKEKQEKNYEEDC